MRDGGIGVRFTPEPWCRWLLERYGVLDRWLDGARICDPTAGDGAMMEALCRMAVSRGVSLDRPLLSRLVLIEREPSFLDAFRRRFRSFFHLDFPEENLICSDVVTRTESLPGDFDILIGNPPWANFTDLPDDYAETLKPFFLKAGLVSAGPRLLLGGSRVDLAALVLSRAMGNLLKSGGTACFFLPMSLFFGDSAHDGFRHFQANGRPFRVQELCTLDPSLQVFPEIRTDYGAASFRMDETHRFPVPVLQLSSAGESCTAAIPVDGSPFGSWHYEGKLSITLPTPLRPDQRVRQGVNTCGAKSVFIFTEQPDFLEDELLFPLANSKCFLGDMTPRRWILLPYDRRSGRPLEWEKIPPRTRDYLAERRDYLAGRRGTMLRSMMRHGFWWALLGVGLYAFAPWKIIWEACGGTRFEPRVFGSIDGKPWQGNQAMHALIPCRTHTEAARLCKALEHSNLTEILRQMRSAGKCNWAQPGKIWRLLHGTAQMEPPC